MPKPRVYWVPSEPSPNAFATGRNPEHGVVAVTAGLLQALDRRQIRAVLAHELGHIKHRDTLTSAVAATVAGAITMLARFGMWGGFRGRDDRDSGGLDLVLRLVVLILAPIAALLVHMAVSRTREYAADARAAAINHDPLALAEALERISTYGHAVPMLHLGLRDEFLEHGSREELLAQSGLDATSIENAIRMRFGGLMSASNLRSVS